MFEPSVHLDNWDISLIQYLLSSSILRWSHALLFHQSVVDFLRSCVLIPLSVSILDCRAIHSCNILETSFLLLVTASTVRGGSIIQRIQLSTGRGQSRKKV